MIYRVIIKISYHQAFFDFDNIETACNFASMAAKNAVKPMSKDDDSDAVDVSIVFVDPKNIVEEKEEEA